MSLIICTKSLKLVSQQFLTRNRTLFTYHRKAERNIRSVISKIQGFTEGCGLRKTNKKITFFALSTFPFGVGTSVILLACRKNHLGHCDKLGVNTDLVTHPKEAEISSASFDWAKLLELVKPDVFYVVVAIVSALVVAALNIYIPAMLGDIINIVSRVLAEPTVSVDFIREIKDPVSRLVLLYITQSLFTFVYISALSHSGEGMASRLRKELFASILKQDISFFDTRQTGEIISRLTADIQEFKSSFKLCISQGLRSFTQSVGCVVSLYIISPKLTGVLLLVLPSIIFVGTAIGSVLRKLSQAAQAQMSHAAAVANEAIGNIRTVRAFAMEDKEMDLYSKELDLAEKLHIELGVGIGAFQGLANLALNGIVLGVLCLGGHLLTSKEISPGSLMAFLVASQTIQRSLAQVSLLFGHYVRGLSAGTRVFQLVNLEPTVQLKGGIQILPEQLNGEVRFEGVSFAYPTRAESTVLKDFTFHLPAGKIVALCGLSGGGKSTVAVLLERFYDVEHGKIYLDDIDIQTLDPSWLRGNVIGFINQEPVLFATTIMENIRYGNPSATDEEVKSAARLANADSFIQSFPLGYQTVLGERGVTVSGGQKQRIAIARALIKNPAVLILDEATSALDTESEKLVQEALDRVVKGRTVLIIAHRLSTIQNADIIAVIAHGKVAELGNHQSLQKLKGLYWQMTRNQENEKLLDGDLPK